MCHGKLVLKGYTGKFSVEILDILSLSIDTTDNCLQKLTRQEVFLLFV